jgi:hypothetical protein
MSKILYHENVSEEPLDIIRYNECDAEMGRTLVSKRCRRLWNEMEHLRDLKTVVGEVLEGFTLPHDVRKILETEYFSHYTEPRGEAQPEPAKVCVPEWIQKLKKELMMAAMKDDFILTRDELIELLGGPVALLEAFPTGRNTNEA